MGTAKKNAPILLLLLGSALLLTQPAAAQTPTYSFGATFQGSILGLYNGVYYDGSGGGYGIAGNACPPSICVFSSFPATAYFTGTTTTQPVTNGGGTVITDTTTATSPQLGSNTRASVTLTPSLNFIPNVGSWAGFGVGPLPSSPSSAIAGSANVNTATPVFIPFAGTSGSLPLVNGTAVLFQQPAATLPGFPSIPLPETLFTGNLTGGAVTYFTTPIQPPTVQTLATATFLQSAGVGQTQQPGPIQQVNPDHSSEAFSPLPPQNQPPPGPDEFSATVYQTADQSQTIIALTGGSVIGGLRTDAYTIAKALATFATIPPPTIQSETDQLAQLVQSIHNQNPSTDITITSYSVNGLAAQIVAKYAGISAVTFNSQGAANLIPAFALDPNIAALSGIKGQSPGSIFNYRSVGDQVSLWSPQVGQQVTVPNVLGFGPPSPLANLIFGLHDVSVLGRNILSEGEINTHGFFPGFLAPGEQFGDAGDTSLLPQIVFGTSSTISGPASLLFQTQVSLGTQLFFDPPPGLSFSLTETTDSPRFVSISLPVDDDTIFGWGLTYFTDSGMSATETSNTGIFDFGPGVDRLDFFALDALGDQTMVNDPFLFGLTFDSDGTFNGTLEVNGSPSGPGTSVPEPSSLALLAGALVGLGVLRQWRLAGWRRDVRFDADEISMPVIASA